MKDSTLGSALEEGSVPAVHGGDRAHVLLVELALAPGAEGDVEARALRVLAAGSAHGLPEAGHGLVLLTLGELAGVGEVGHAGRAAAAVQGLLGGAGGGDCDAGEISK